MRDERKRDAQGTPLSEVIDKLLRAYQLDHKMKEYDIIAAWPELMGVAVANRTRELAIRNGVLHIYLDSSVMRDELQAGKTIIIERVNQFAGSKVIHDVWFG